MAVAAGGGLRAGDIRVWAYVGFSAQLARSQWGGQPVSANRIYKTLRRHGLNTWIRRLSLVAGYASPPVPEPLLPPKRLHLEAEHPGDLVQFDCFHITGTKSQVWQYTAIDIAENLGAELDRALKQKLSSAQVLKNLPDLEVEATRARRRRGRPGFARYLLLETRADFDFQETPDLPGLRPLQQLQ